MAGTLIPVSASTSSLLADAPTYAAQAAASAAAAALSEAATAADVVTTNADVVLTNADVVLTNADVVLTNADVVSTNADAVATAADRVQTGLDAAAAALYKVEDAINSATSKATPVDADELGIVDSAASNVLKKLTWANLKATLLSTWKDATGGLVGLTLFKINFKNAANTFTSFLTNTNTASRTYTFPDYDATVATIDGTETFTNKTLTTPTVTSQTISGTAGNLYASNWTPTATNDTNIATSSTYSTSFFQRNMGWVQFQLVFDVDPTAAGECIILLSLPVASTFASDRLLNGAGAGGQIASPTTLVPVNVSADTTTNQIRVRFFAVDTGNSRFRITGGYSIQ
jgi:hypothetical protein